MKKIFLMVTMLMVAVATLSAEVLKTRTEYCDAYNANAEVKLIETKDNDYTVSWTYNNGKDVIDIYICASPEHALDVWSSDLQTLKENRTLITYDVKELNDKQAKAIGLKAGTYLVRLFCCI